MNYLIIAVVCYIASTLGAICGIGGGVIIKPVLDVLGIMPVTTISFLSGCTVLSMSFVSLYRNIRGNKEVSFDGKFATVLALGAVIGGLSGKVMYPNIVNGLDNSNGIGAIQAIVLGIVTFGTFFYTIYKKRIRTIKIRSRLIVLIVGICLGVMASFLGIGGGPINLVALFFLFSMTTKEAA